MRNWGDTLDLKDIIDADDETPFEQMRDLIVQRMKDKWPTRLDENSPDYDEKLADLVYELTNEETLDNFNFTFDQFYSWADDNNVWVATIL